MSPGVKRSATAAIPPRRRRASLDGADERRERDFSASVVVHVDARQQNLDDAGARGAAGRRSCSLAKPRRRRRPSGSQCRARPAPVRKSASESGARPAAIEPASRRWRGGHDFCTGQHVGRHEQARVGVRLDLLGERQARRVRRDARNLALSG